MLRQINYYILYSGKLSCRDLMGLTTLILIFTIKIHKYVSGFSFLYYF